MSSLSIAATAATQIAGRAPNRQQRDEEEYDCLEIRAKDAKENMLSLLVFAIITSIDRYDRMLSDEMMKYKIKALIDCVL